MFRTVNVEYQNILIRSVHKEIIPEFSFVTCLNQSNQRFSFLKPFLIFHRAFNFLLQYSRPTEKKSNYLQEISTVTTRVNLQEMFRSFCALGKMQFLSSN